MVTTPSDRDVNILELMLPYCNLKWPLQKLIWDVNGIHFDVADCAPNVFNGPGYANCRPLVLQQLHRTSYGDGSCVPLMKMVLRSTSTRRL